MKYQAINDINYAGKNIKKNREFDTLSFFEGLYGTIVRTSLKEFPLIPLELLKHNCKIIKI
jgi:hypothetical protein